MITRHRWLAPLRLLALALACCRDEGDDNDLDQAAADASAKPGSSDAAVLDSSGFDAAPTPDAAIAAGGGADAEGVCRTYVSDSLISHACFHEKMGPYAERAAALLPATPEIEINRAHTSFRIRLSARTGGRYGGVVRYDARFAGNYAIFARDASVRVQAPQGTLAPSFEHGTQICPELPSVSSYLFESRTYTFEITSDVQEIVLVVEWMDEGTVEDAYRFECMGGARPPRDAAVFVLDVGRDAATQTHPNAMPYVDAAPRPGDSVTANDGSPRVVPDSSVPASDAGETLVDTAMPAEAGTCVEIDPVLEHSCLHAMHGPFAMVSATATQQSAPDVNAVHTAFQTSLPAQGLGHLTYRATIAGEYVFYLDREVPLVLRAGDAVVPPSHVGPVTGCTGITHFRVFSLATGVRYALEVGPVAGDQTTLIIESVQALTPGSWTQRIEPCP